MGRAAQPVMLQLLNGNKSKKSAKELQDRLDREISIRPKTDNVKSPDWLSPFAKQEFDKMVQELMEVDLVTNVDVNALAMYCEAYDNYVQCSQLIREEGLMVEYTNKAAETNKVPHPLLTKQKALFEQMKALSTEFGLTPAARAKIAIRKEPEKEKSMEEIMYGDI